MKECIFCTIASHNEPHHEIWWSDESFVAFLDASPTQRGHTLLIPRKHQENILDVSVNEYNDLMSAARVVGNRMREFFNVPGTAMIVEGMSVAHLHVHLIPISERGQLGSFPKYEITSKEMAELGEQLRESEKF